MSDADYTKRSSVKLIARIYANGHEIIAEGLGRRSRLKRQKRGDRLPGDHFFIDLQLLNIPILASHFPNQYLPGLVVIEELFPLHRDDNQDKHELNANFHE